MTNSGSERPGEFELIAELFAPLATAPGAFGLTDDAAVVAPPAGHELVVTMDALIEGVHFFASDPPDLIARKALRVNLSDLAAKGCAPLGYLMALSIPQKVEMSWLRAFARGLAEDQQIFGISLFGGDTTATPGPLTIAITASGHLPVGRMLRRSGAKPGDVVFVSGTIGDAGGGLACLKGEGAHLSNIDRDHLVRRFQLPEPRTSLGPSLIGVASASLDVSDGLLADLGHIAAASAVRVVVEAERVPLSPALIALWPQAKERIVRAVTAGDDYEIAFTAPPSSRATIVAASARAGLPVAEIGRVETGQGVALLDNGGQEIPVDRRGYVHF
jgi:thiamine-monophosphate kinase